MPVEKVSLQTRSRSMRNVAVLSAKTSLREVFLLSADVLQGSVPESFLQSYAHIDILHRSLLFFFLYAIFAYATLYMKIKWQTLPTMQKIWKTSWEPKNLYFALKIGSFNA